MSTGIPYKIVNQDDVPKSNQLPPSDNEVSHWAAAQVESAFGPEHLNESFLASLNSSKRTPSDESPVKASGESSSRSHTESSSSPLALNLLRRLSFWWWWETASAVVTVLSLLAIVLALRLYQGQPLPDWPYGISINSLVSVFVVFMKGSVAMILTSGIGQLKFDWFKRTSKPLSHIIAFDEASRGPLGALRLIWTSRHRHLLATLGALITLTGILIDPFTQQLLRFDSCQRPNTVARATVPRAQLFNQAQGPASASPGMIAAINTGLFYPGLYSYTFTCPTGNCTLPTSYYSVAFCSTCMNMHDEIQILTSPPEILNLGSMGLPYNYTYTLWTNTTLPSGLTATWNAVNGSSLLFLSAVTSNNTNELVIEMILNKGASPSIGRAYGEFGNCPEDPQNTDWGCLGYGGSSCSVIPCIKVYSGDIRAGNLTENTTSFIDSWSSTNISNTFYLSSVDMQCLSGSARVQTLDLISANSTQREEQWLPIPVAVDPVTGTVQADPSLQNGLELSQLIPKQCIYQISKSTSDDVLSYLGQYLNGNVSMSGGKSIIFGKSDGTDILQYIYNSGKITFDHVQEYLDSMTLSMTNYVRQNGNVSNNDPVIGTVLETMTCVHVRWPWIVYPATVVLLTLFFFASLMSVVHRESDSGKEAHLLHTGDQPFPSPQHDFKSSVLPLLFHGFDDESSTVLRDMGRSNLVADLQKNAKQVQVQMVMTERGWKFVVQDRRKCE